MPSRVEHLAKAGRAADVEELTRRAGLEDWAITALFYRAVHLLEAYFSREDVHHTNHTARSRAIAREFPETYGAYVELTRLSRLARYESLDSLEPGDYEAARAAFAAIQSAIRTEPA
jgi:hypothetical protein